MGMLQSLKNIPLRSVISTLNILEREEKLKATLLGIGPMTMTVIRATIELAKEKDFPVMFIPSRNQIDIDEFGHGYVMNWDQKRFADTIDTICRETGFDGILYLWRDHGGPWQRDEEYRLKLPINESMDRAKKSYLSDMDNGFTVLHIDPTKDPHIDTVLPAEVIIDRIIELMDWIENKRKEKDLGTIDYEVGTEEIKGSAIDPVAFEKFIINLLKRLDEKKLPRPCFIVGQTGTLLRMRKNVGKYNLTMTKELTKIAKRYGLLFKEHNTDYLDEKILELHPEIGIGMSNVAPEFGHEETKAYLELTEIEEKTAKKKKFDTSNFVNIIQEAVLKSGKWRKWLFKEDTGLTESDIIADKEKLKEIIIVNGHYMYNEPQVESSIKKLINNLRKYCNIKNPEKIVIDRVKNSIMKYVTAFNLEGLTSKILNRVGGGK